MHRLGIASPYRTKLLEEADPENRVAERVMLTTLEASRRQYERGDTPENAKNTAEKTQ